MPVRLSVLHAKRSPRLTLGTAALEFGLIAPLLLILLMGLVELGTGIRQAMQAQDAAEAGALYASKHGWDPTAITAAVVNATSAGDMTASPAPVQFCGCPGPAGITAADCGASCAGSSPSHYVRVSASLPRHSILSGLDLPIPATLVGHATVRVQ